jgi:serine/threonine protein kinase/Tfp pilus assembly protein PilF
LERLLAEQRERWPRGERLPVELFLEQHPAVRDDTEAVLHLIFNEVVLRERAGEVPCLEEYQKRFPHLAAELELQFTLDRALRSELRPQPDVLTSTLKAPVDPQALSAPELESVPGYEVLRELGHGGMGVVYQAWHNSLSRMVALKMIRSGSHAGAEELARFRTEAEAVARLQHPNIVQIYEVGEHDGRPFLALEYVDGGSLDRRLNGTPQTPPDAARLVETLAHTVHHAHERGIVHRDLKPANVLLASGGRQPPVDDEGTGGLRPPPGDLAPKITDFGLAKVLIGGSAEQTQTGAILGTPSYMAPEQARGRGRAIGPATDVYALGAILYELLTGRPPFKATSVMETLHQVASDEPVPPRALQPKLPRDLETICLKCLEKDPRKRYASAKELADDLGHFLAGEPIIARPISRWERGVKWARRRPALAALVVVSAVAILSALLAGVGRYEIRLREAEAQLREYQRVEDTRLRAEKSIAAAQVASEHRELDEAWDQVKQALAVLEPEPRLADLKDQAESLRADIERGLGAQKARAHDRDAYEKQFKPLHEAVLFHSSQVTGLDRPANVAAIRRDAPAALDLFGMLGEGGPPLNPDHFSEAEREDITRSSYVLLLLLAEARADPLPSENADVQAGKALAVLDRAARLRPPNRVYHLQRADYLARLGQKAGAEGERRLAEAPDLPRADAADYFLLGTGQYRRHDWGPAITSFGEALRLGHDDFWPQFMIGLCYLGGRRPSEASAHLSACLGRKPDFFWAHLVQGFAQGELGSLALASTRLPEEQRRKEAGQHFQAAEALFGRADDLRDRHNEDQGYVLLVNRGVLRLRQGRLGDAGKDLRAATGLRPKQYQAYLNLAEVYERQANLKAALAQLDEGLRGAPREPILYRSRARLRRKGRDWADALADLKEALRYEPEDGPSRALAADDHAECGMMLALLKRDGEAVAEYEGALRLNPDLTVAHRLRAEALFRLDRLEETVAAYDQYLARARLSLEAFAEKKEPVAEAYAARGLVHWMLRRPEAALADYTQSLALAPDAANYAFRGWVYLEDGAPQSALRDFREALKRDPGNGDAYAGRGYVLVQQGQYREAARDAEEARRGKPSARTLFNAARIYAQAAARAEADPRLTAREGPALHAAYADRAAQLLWLALDATPAPQRDRFRTNYILKDPALNPIRRTPAFNRLSFADSRAPEEHRPEPPQAP